MLSSALPVPQEQLCLYIAFDMATSDTSKKKFDWHCSKDSQACRLTARIQYAEEKAKRALVSSDPQQNSPAQNQSKSMLTAKRVLSLEQEVVSLTNSKRDLTQKMNRWADPIHHMHSTIVICAKLSRC